jgi:hypothetical protein
MSGASQSTHDGSNCAVAAILKFRIPDQISEVLNVFTDRISLETVINFCGSF